jgi:hypothetical protein
MQNIIDKRVKLTEEDKLKIKNLFNPNNHSRFTGATKIAKEFGVSKRTIQFIQNPERLKLNRLNAKQRKLNIPKSEAQIKLELHLKNKKKEEYNTLNSVFMLEPEIKNKIKLQERENAKMLKIIDRQNALKLRIIKREMEIEIRKLNKKIFRERRLEEMKSLRKSNLKLT